MSRPTDIADDEVFRIENLTMAYGDYVVMRDLNFSAAAKARFCAT